MVTDWRRRITVRLFGTITLLIISQLIALSTVPSDPLTYLWYALTVLLTVLAYARGRTFGLIASLVTIFVLGTYDVLQNFVLHAIASAPAVNVSWFIVFPLVGFVAGDFGEVQRAMSAAIEHQDQRSAQVPLIDDHGQWWNRRGFFLFLENEVLRSDRRTGRRQRAQDPTRTPDALPIVRLAEEYTSIVVVEIRHFADLAMVYGGPQQEAILTWCMDQISSLTRVVDIKARIAPGTMATILGETPSSGARVLVERLQKDIQEYRWTVGSRGGRQIKLDIQCGYATAAEDGDTPEALLDVAMRRLAQDLG